MMLTREERVGGVFIRVEEESWRRAIPSKRTAECVDKTINFYSFAQISNFCAFLFYPASNHAADLRAECLLLYSGMNKKSNAK